MEIKECQHPAYYEHNRNDVKQIVHKTCLTIQKINQAFTGVRRSLPGSGIVKGTSKNTFEVGVYGFPVPDSNFYNDLHSFLFSCVAENCVGFQDLG